MAKPFLREPAQPLFSAPVAGMAVGLLLLAGCDTQQVTRSAEAPAIAPLAQVEIVDADTPGCSDSAITPALIETVTEQVEVQAAVLAPDGSLTVPAAYQTLTRQQILRERGEVTFDTPCPHVQTPPFLAAVQRSLIARGYYSGAITGQMSPELGQAIERFQIDQDDVPAPILTLRSARSMGLIALPRDAL